LLAHGADIDADNGGGMTPIMFASLFGRTRVVELLKAHGAALNRRNRFGISANLMVKALTFGNRVFGRRSTPSDSSP